MKNLTNYCVYVLSVMFFSCQPQDHEVMETARELKPMNEALKDYSKSYKMIIWGTNDGVNYFVVDTLKLKGDDIYIKQK